MGRARQSSIPATSGEHDGDPARALGPEKLACHGSGWKWQNWQEECSIRLFFFPWWSLHICRFLAKALDKEFRTWLLVRGLLVVTWPESADFFVLGCWAGRIGWELENPRNLEGRGHIQQTCPWNDNTSPKTCSNLLRHGADCFTHDLVSKVCSSVRDQSYFNSMKNVRLGDIK